MKIRVIRSAVIDAPIDRVWALLRDFNSHGQWHPAVADSRIENACDGDVVGCVRRVNLTDGAELREQLLHHSDRDTTFAYSILDSSLPLFDHVATVRLMPVTDGGLTFWHWRVQFNAPDDRAAELENLVRRQVCEAGFTGLRMFLSEQAKPSPRPSGMAETVAVEAPVGGSLPSRAVVVTASGGPEVLSLANMTVDAPEPRQVRIRQTAAAVNAIDLGHRRGTSAGFEPPGTPGLEGVGEIIDVGPLVNGLFPGDRVAYMTRTTGAYAEIRCVDADACVPLADGVSDIEASLLLKGVTAALLFGRIFRAAPGSSVLIQAAAGGLGHVLGQWARSMDLTVIGTVSTPEQAIFSREHGCDYPIVVAADVPLSTEVMRITNGRGVDYWVNGDGVHGLDEAIACLSRGGHCAVIGAGDDKPFSLDMASLKRRSLSVSALDCFDYLDDRVYLQRLAHQLFAKIQNRAIIPAVEVFPLSQVAEVHHRIETGNLQGAVVLAPDG